MRRIEYSYLKTTDGKEIRNLKYSGVYSIINKLNGKRYIGSSRNIYSRLIDHFLVAYNKDGRKKGYKGKIHHAINKYGLENFELEVMVKCPAEYNLKLEQWFLDNLKPEYNILKTAGSCLGRFPTLEQIEKQKEGQRRSRENDPDFFKKRKEIGRMAATIRTGMSEEVISNIKEYVAKKYSYEYIADMFSVSVNIIKNISHGKRGKHVTKSETGIPLYEKIKYYIIDIFDNTLTSYTGWKELKENGVIKHESAISSSLKDISRLINWRYKICKVEDLYLVLSFINHNYTEEDIIRYREYHQDKAGNRKGFKCSEEHIQKIREKKIGKIPSEETRKKMSYSQQKRYNKLI